MDTEKNLDPGVKLFPGCAIYPVGLAIFLGVLGLIAFAIYIASRFTPPPMLDPSYPL